MPDLLKFNGRGLLEGVLTLWESMCNILCLHQDNLQWIINPMTEINVDAMVDPSDTETWPGKEYLVHETTNGQNVVRVVQRRSNTNDVLANMQYHDQNYQRGSFVTDAVQGLPGYRKDMTYREAAMNLDQALGVYSLMGENIEAGAIYAVTAAAEFIARYATYKDYQGMYTADELKALGITADTDPNTINGVAGVPPLDGSFHISGIQALMKENETLTNIKTIIIPLANNPRFGQYINPYKALKAIELRTNMTDEGIIVSEDEAKKIEAQEYEQLAAQKTAEIEKAELEKAHSIADLTTKVSNLDPAAAASNTGATPSAEVTQ